MSKAEACGGQAAVFSALGDPTRLALVATLADGEPRSIVALSADSGLTRQAVTKHLHVLERAGLVRGLRMGRESRFAFEPSGMAEATAFLRTVSERWDEALGRLRRLVEE
jgi:DNA-binding transcriptional ArsR family regulator